ncbi:MAG: hypothetical protein R3A48_14010 [Polyangiales bacterium]
MRLALALALLSACTLEPAGGDCASDQREACRADGDCRCGAPCVPGTACPDGAEGPEGCASLGDGGGVCVDIAWLTGLPRGRVPCGASTCEAATAQCVQWADGAVGCAPRCESNGGCDSGCCTALRDARGADLGSVCAPGPGYRCAADTPAGRSCDPPCDPGALCASWDGAPRCLRGAAPRASGRHLLRGSGRSPGLPPRRAPLRGAADGSTRVHLPRRVRRGHLGCAWNPMRCRRFDRGPRQEQLRAARRRGDLLRAPRGRVRVRRAPGDRAGELPRGALLGVRRDGALRDQREGRRRRRRVPQRLLTAAGPATGRRG